MDKIVLLQQVQHRKIMNIWATFTIHYMNQVYLLIGGNMGDRNANLNNALALIESKLGVIKKVSSVFETEAWGFTEQPAFLNQALLIQTQLNAESLMIEILLLEKEMGRERTIPMGPRMIDVDIIYFNEAIVNHENLIIPHPKMSERKFVLMPIAEIAPDFIHPILHKSNTALLKECGDSLAVHKKTG
jgi:2-amino-4-hydroxy-6-hydroxymethyldihydropteridine diphosphokinase